MEESFFSSFPQKDSIDKNKKTNLTCLFPFTMLDVDADVASLSAEIKRLGKLGPDGKTVVKYGVLFRETGDVCASIVFYSFFCFFSLLSFSTSSLFRLTLTSFSSQNLKTPVEALMGTLRAAKKRSVVDFQGQLLLQGVHDDVDVILLPEAGAVAAAAAVAEAEGEKKEAEEPAAVAAPAVAAAAAVVAP